MYIMFVRLQLKINRLLLVLYKYNRRIAMRGIDTQTKKIREQVFEEVARAAYSTGDVSHELEEIPYKITPRMFRLPLRAFGEKELLHQKEFVLQWDFHSDH